MGLGSAAGAALVPSASARQRDWIDVHMHVIGGPDRQFGHAVALAVAEMDRRNIAKAVVFPPPFPRPGFDHPAYTDELSRYPGRFGFLGGGGFLNPMLHQIASTDVTPAVRQKFSDLARRMVDAGAVGFGEIALLHLSLVANHSFEETTPEHPLMLLLAEIAGSAQLVIDLHIDPVVLDSMRTPSFLKSKLNPPTLRGNVASFEKLLAHDRNARIVWAHGGSDFTGNMSAALISRLMDAHPNLYMSLRPVRAGMHHAPAAGLQFRNTIMTDAGIHRAWLDLLRRHTDRFVLGADAFFLAGSAPPDSPLRTLARGNEMRLDAVGQLLQRLPADLGRKIARENATRLYRLQPV